MTDLDIEKAQAALEAAEGLLRSALFICVEAVESPSAAQLRALQPFFPERNLLALRSAAIAGTLRLGPVLPDAIEEYAQLALAGTGLAWHAELPNADDLSRAGLGAI